MKTVAILQARMTSSRLPGKMLLPLLQKPLVQHVLERTRRATKLDFVVLAYPLLDHPSFLPVLQCFTNTPGVPLGSYAFQGDENDLVERYLGAARAYEADMIVRIPCDNPCVDPEYIDAAVQSYRDGCFTFFSNTRILYPYGPSCIDGLGAEVLSVSRLKWLDQVTQGEPELREHPHKYFYNHADLGGGGVLIQCGNVENPLRLDVNTHADYDFIKSIYDHFGRNDFTAADVVAYLDSKKVSA